MAGAPASRASNATTAARLGRPHCRGDREAPGVDPELAPVLATQRVAAQASSTAAGNLCSVASVVDGDDGDPRLAVELPHARRTCACRGHRFTHPPPWK